MFIPTRSYYLRTPGYIIIILALLVLIGWQFNITVLKSITADMTAMNPVTAITFIGTGFWLISIKDFNIKLRFPVVLCGWFTLLVGLLHSVSYLLALDWLRFDHFLFKEKVESSTINSHIAPITAFLFFLTGINMLSIYSNNKWLLKTRAYLIIIIFIVAYASILGYLYGRDSAYRVEGISTIALSTAILFLLLSIGLFLSNIETGLPKLFASILEGSTLFRRVTMFMLAFPPLLGYLRIWGERMGYFNHEYGFELYTIVFTITVFLLLYYYANLLNKKQKASITLEKKLSESERKFHEMITSLKEGVASINFEGKVLFCNPSFCNILEYAEQELNGKVIVEMIIPSERKEEFYGRLEKRKTVN